MSIDKRNRSPSPSFFLTKSPTLSCFHLVVYLDRNAVYLINDVGEAHARLKSNLGLMNVTNEEIKKLPKSEYYHLREIFVRENKPAFISLINSDGIYSVMIQSKK